MTVKEFLEKEKIYEYSLISFDEVSVIDQRRAGRMFDGKGCQTVVPFLIPYLVKDGEETNISVYAHSRDYHYYFKELSQRMKDTFGEIAAACDTSPINEVECAVKAGLGSIGKNGLLINRRYGTYAFIGEIFFSLPITDPIFDGITRRDKGHFCRMCGACERACPTNGINDKSRCISFINQKKKLEGEDEKIIIDSGIVWGCDICQQSCPANKNAQATDIGFFKEKRTPYLTEELLDKMINEDSFSQRAYAWRGEEVVRRNIRLCKKKENALQ